MLALRVAGGFIRFQVGVAYGIKRTKWNLLKRKRLLFRIPAICVARQSEQQNSDK